MEVFLVAAIGLLGLGYIHIRDQRRARNRRGEYLAACRPLFTQAEMSLDPFGYPKIAGDYRGHRFFVDLIVDALAVRKLPSLWMRVTLIEPLVIQEQLSIMMRPLGTEFFSNFDGLPHRLETPADWPERAIVRCKSHGDQVFVSRLDDHIDFFKNPRAKELLVTSRGLRFVWQVDEAERSDYLLLRQARFEQGPLDPAVLQGILDRAVSLSGELRREELPLSTAARACRHAYAT